MNPRFTVVLRAAALSLVLVAASACKETAPAGDSANADAHREVLASVADNVLIPLTQQFATAAEDLHMVGTDYANNPTPENLVSVQARFTSAMAIWQQLELLQVGPAGLMGEIAGGENLRDAIYSWPIVNSCRVDQETARQGYVTGLSQALPNVRGLDALEYLLFTASTEHTCSTGSTFATSGEWAAIGDAAAVTARRAEHVGALVADLLNSAQGLVDHWDPTVADSFRDKFAQAGVDTSVYATAQEGLNALSDAMFYLEKETKDMKLAVPAGVIDCTESICPESRESRYANLSMANIISNVEAFRRVFAGGEPGGADVGFDDLLDAMGQGALATRLDQELQAAVTALEGLPATLLEAVNTAPADVLAAYEVVRTPIQTFRTEVLSLLDLELPQRAEGDND